VNNNMPLSVDTGRGLSINYLGKNLYSKYDPSQTSIKIAHRLELYEETLYIVPSPLLLYGIREILNKLPQSSYLLGIEIDQNLMHETINSQIKIDNDNFKIYRLDSREQLKSAIEDLSVWKYRKCQLIPLNYGYNLYKEKYDYLYNFATVILNTFWRNRLTINKLGRLWVKNIFNNIPLVTPERPDNHGKSIVVCGAGVSLEETTVLLKKNRDDIYIIAVDTALNSLLESEIIPDLVFALESQFYNLGDFYNSFGKNIDLLTDITGYPAVCRALKGKVYFYASDFFQNALLDRIETHLCLALKIPPLGSVGVAAVHTALKLFNAPIFLTGLDFSFVPGKSHSKGTPFSNSLLRISNRFKPAGSFNISMKRNLLQKKGKVEGKRINTDSILESYAMLLTDIISQEERVYDLTNSGYPLGAEYIDEENFCEMIKYRTSNFDGNCIPQIDPNVSNNLLKQEKYFLEALIGEWVSFVATDSEQIPDLLISALEKVDYIYLDFPDRLPHPIKEISFISRAVTSAREYLKIVDRLIK